MWRHGSTVAAWFAAAAFVAATFSSASACHYYRAVMTELDQVQDSLATPREPIESEIEHRGGKRRYRTDALPGEELGAHLRRHEERMKRIAELLEEMSREEDKRRDEERRKD